MDRLSVIKKLNKPLIERRRRERINHHIEELNRLIVQPLLRHRRSIRKLEKADILEITVEYLKMCARNRLPVTMPPSPSSDGSPPSQSNLDVLSQQIQQLDGLATLHHLLIENGEGPELSTMNHHHHHHQSVNNAAFIPFAAAAAAAAAACGAPQFGASQDGLNHLNPNHSTNNNSHLNSSLHSVATMGGRPTSQSTTPPGFLNQSIANSEGDDENDETTTTGTSPVTKQRSPSTDSSGTSTSASSASSSSSSPSSGRKSVQLSGSSEASSSNNANGGSSDLLMIAPTPSSSSSNGITVSAGAAGNGSMWRPW